MNSSMLMSLSISIAFGVAAVNSAERPSVGGSGNEPLTSSIRGSGVEASSGLASVVCTYAFKLATVGLLAMVKLYRCESNLLWSCCVPADGGPESPSASNEGNDEDDWPEDVARAELL
ncbi:hypothetical protein OGAPHI_006902 [Ogataea philodendri]|uniref:Secreted protein n=1 Tax=Ogataea philodendri TaxID=1378263 RepID=A0A9P8SZD8_9ASCO|nr:uncharacterized protein OGAPHI_006902 [Ogataea philodendri]KAH3660316.1 hypothetical protein OGAPHI_006902 [Ogataea philodendri]